MAETAKRPEPRGRLRVLFVCSLNQWRSPTAEALYRGDPRLEVRSAGIRSNARRRIGTGDLGWANVVFVMEVDHKRWIQERFGDLGLPPIRVLEISNNLGYMDTELQRVLRLAIDPEIDALTGPGAPPA
jgi:predicted protein tyrosine phosphatase